jgi:flagellar assembly protein FliH
VVSLLGELRPEGQVRSATPQPVAWTPPALNAARPALNPQPRVFPMADPNPRQQAVQLLETARQQAHEIILQAETMADAAVAEAQAEIEAERVNAYQQGIAAAQAESQAYLQAAVQMIQQVQAWKEQLLAQAEPIVLDLVKDIARSMFGAGLILSGSDLQANLNRAIEDARALGDLIVYLNPQDAANLEPSWKDFHMSIIGKKIHVIPMEQIRPGGCFVQGQTGTVDARVETRLATVMETLGAVQQGEEALL